MTVTWPSVNTLKNQIDFYQLMLFHEKQNDDLVAITNPNDLLEYPKKSKKVMARKCLVRKFKETGAFHFASPSFNKVLKKNDLTANGYEVSSS